MYYYIFYCNERANTLFAVGLRNKICLEISLALTCACGGGVVPMADQQKIDGWREGEARRASRTIESRCPASQGVAGEAAEEYCTRVNYCGETDAQNNIKIQKGGVGVAAAAGVPSVGASRAGERIARAPAAASADGVFVRRRARGSLCHRGPRPRV